MYMYINDDRMLVTSDNMKAFAFILLASLLVASCVEGRLLTVNNETIESTHCNRQEPEVGLSTEIYFA